MSSDELERIERDPRPTAPPRRVLFLYMQSTGAGHRRAAEAVAAAMARLDPSVETTALNLVDFSNQTLHDVYHEVRTSLIREAPHFLGQLYQWYDKPRDYDRSLFDRILLAFQRLNLRDLVKDLERDAYDAVVNTHFFTAELCAALRREGRLDTPLYTIATDFVTHGMWIHEPCDGYFVATEGAGDYLVANGVDQARVHVTGIPIDPVFATVKARKRCRMRLDVGVDRPVIALLTGGTKPEVAAALLEDVLALERAVHVVAVAGGDAERGAALDAVHVPARHRVTRLGFTERMDEVLRASDLLLTKAGGLTIAEGLALGRPFAIVSPTPDQEAQNTDYVLENGAGVRIHHPSTIPFKLGRLLADPKRLQQLRSHARALGRPRAAFDVAARVLARIGAGVARPAAAAPPEVGTRTG